jgi:hypothetical protein
VVLGQVCRVITTIFCTVNVIIKGDSGVVNLYVCWVRENNLVDPLRIVDLESISVVLLAAKMQCCDMLTCNLQRRSS